MLSVQVRWESDSPSVRNYLVLQRLPSHDVEFPIQESRGPYRIEDVLSGTKPTGTMSASLDSI